MRSAVLLILFLPVLAACAERGPPAEVLDWNASRTEVNRSDALARAGSPEAARDALLTAFRLAAGVHRSLRDGGPADTRGYQLPGRLDVLTRLAEISLQLGRDDPEFLRRGIRLAYRALTDNPEHPTPYGLFGEALARIGCLERAAENLEKHLELLPDGARTPGRARLTEVLLQRAARALADGEPACEAVARRHLTRARELSPGPEGDPRVIRALEDLNRKYAEEANEAGRRGQALELARVHARYGFLDTAKEALDVVVKRSGVVGEVRWVVARFYYEGLNTSDSLEKAAQVYVDLLRDDPDAELPMAGWVRVQRRLGNIQPALDRFLGRKEPGADLRVELILTLFDRALLRNETDYEGWKVDRDEIDLLLAGEISPRRRADLLVELGFLCLRVQDPDRLERLNANLRRAWPGDLRVMALEAGALDLRMEDVLPDTEDRGDK